MSTFAPTTFVERGSPFNIAIAGLGVDEVACRRLFAREIERVASGSTLAGGLGGRTAVILSGWACEMRILSDGGRQIFCFVTPGDVIDISPRGKQASRGILALTRLELIDAQILLRDQARFGKSDLGAQIDSLRARRQERLLDHIVRLGRKSAYERVIHLLLELHERLSAIGLAKSGSFRAPLTQEHMADALGLSLVHINRTLKQLRREGLIELTSGAVTLLKPGQLMALAGYEADAFVEADRPAVRRLSYAEQRL